jgi:hypothetical protein
MKKLKTLTLNLLALAMFSSCTNSHLDNSIIVTSLDHENQLNSIYPLNTGRSWNFQLEQFQNDVPNTKFTEMTISIVSNDTNTAVINRFYPNSSIQPNQTLATIYPDHIDLSRYVQKSVFESLGSKISNEGKDFITILKLPLETGESWDGRIFQGGTEKLQISGNEKITVPAGTFDALKVQHHLAYDNGKEDNLYYWYAKGIGTVKMHEELTYRLSGNWVKLKSIGVLKSFTDK